MDILKIKKRDGSEQDFLLSKIENVIEKAIKETLPDHPSDAVSNVTNTVYSELQILCDDAYTRKNDKCVDGCPTVEEIQDIIERALMEHGYFDTAKAFILYRQLHKKMRDRDLFKKRQNLKPYEYPELYEYTDAIRHSYWIHTEFNYTSDVNDFKVNVTEVERNAIKNSMLAIAQIEVAVKTFWGDLYKKLPKPEIGAVGATFAESEVRHTDAYSHLLEILGLNDEFGKMREIPVLNKRYNYLERVTELARTDENRQYAQAVLLFALFVEHVSLFSQFLIMMSFNKHKNLFKGLSNAVEATSKEEQIHGMFGIDLINIIRVEHPEWFDEDMEKQLTDFCLDTYKVEEELIDWIFEKGELDFLSKVEIQEFVKNRLNNSLASIGLPRILPVDLALVEKNEWFDNEVIATKHVDFFNKRSINYNKRSVSVTSDDLFD